MKKEETSILNNIRIELCKKGCIVHRANVGKFFTLDGRMIQIGVDGHSDLYGHRPDGKAFYIEVKTQSGKIRDKQKEFLKVMKETGANAGIARNAEDAIKLVFSEVKNATDD